MTFLLAAGFVAGVIDSVIGGGGLITIPALMLRMGISPATVGTNKIAGTAVTLTAMLVYGFNKRVPWEVALKFAGWVGLGSVLGAFFSPRFLAPLYPAMLWVGTGLCVVTLFLKDKILSWMKSHHQRTGNSLSPLAIGLGLVCGLYDGAWGPGGGTFMFLALFYATPMGLMGAIAASKVANFFSSLLALGAFGVQGYVQWGFGSLFAMSLVGGALVGSHLALKHAERILTPLLLIVTALLLWKHL
ncbi:MAG: TSUP family transporter [Elusimicrobia bacterium]|nr:TSUP family transporter [Elusimicrobiota bacterium]